MAFFPLLRLAWYIQCLPFWPGIACDCRQKIKNKSGQFNSRKRFSLLSAFTENKKAGGLKPKVWVASPHTRKMTSQSSTRDELCVRAVMNMQSAHGSFHIFSFCGFGLHICVYTESLSPRLTVNVAKRSKKNRHLSVSPSALERPCDSESESAHRRQQQRRRSPVTSGVFGGLSGG